MAWGKRADASQRPAELRVLGSCASDGSGDGICDAADSDTTSTHDLRQLKQRRNKLVVDAAMAAASLADRLAEVEKLKRQMAVHKMDAAYWASAAEEADRVIQSLGGGVT